MISIVIAVAIQLLWSLIGFIRIQNQFNRSRCPTMDRYIAELGFWRTLNHFGLMGIWILITFSYPYRSRHHS